MNHLFKLLPEVMGRLEVSQSLNLAIDDLWQQTPFSFWFLTATHVSALIAAILFSTGCMRWIKRSTRSLFPPLS